MITYKYWFFYIKPKTYNSITDDFPISVDEETYIYAYTDSKYLADLFYAMHDMDCFKCKKIDMTKEDVHEIAMSERNKIITKHNFRTRYFGNITSAEIAVTREELYAVEEAVRSTIMKCSLKMDLVNPNIFDDDVLTTLQKLRYWDFWGYQRGDITGSPFDYTTFHIDIDELKVYTELFAPLLVER